MNQSAVFVSSTNPPSLFGGPFSGERYRVQEQERHREWNQEHKRDGDDDEEEEEEEEDDDDDDDEGEDEADGHEQEHEQDGNIASGSPSVFESIFGSQVEEQEYSQQLDTQLTATVQEDEETQGDLFVPLDKASSDFLVSHNLDEDNESPDPGPRYVLRPGLRNMLRDFIPISTVFDIDKTGTFDPKQQEEPHIIANRLPGRLRISGSLHLQNQSARNISKQPRPVLSTGLGTVRRCGYRKLLRFALKSAQSLERLKSLRADVSTIKDSGARVRGQDYWPYDENGNIVDSSVLSASNIVNDRLRNRDKAKEAKNEDEVHLGMPAMRGCKGCWTKGLEDKCPLMNGAQYPCRYCVENEDECDLFLEPDLKARCVDCANRKRADCCFDTIPEKRGSCKNCQEKGWKCIAGPKNLSKRRLYTKKKLLSSRDLNVPEDPPDDLDTNIRSSLIESAQDEDSTSPKVGIESVSDINGVQGQKNRSEIAEAEEEAEDAEDEMGPENENEPEVEFQMEEENDLGKRLRTNRAQMHSIPNYREGHQSTALMEDKGIQHQVFDRTQSSSTILPGSFSGHVGLNSNIYNNVSNSTSKKRKKDKGKSSKTARYRVNRKRSRAARTAVRPPNPLKLAQPPKPLFNAPVPRLVTISLFGHEWRHRPRQNPSLAITVRRYGPPAQRDSLSKAWRQKYITDLVRPASKPAQDLRWTGSAILASSLPPPPPPSQLTQQTSYMMSGALPSIQTPAPGAPQILPQPAARMASQMRQRKTVKTMMHHPIRLYAKPKLCNWCKQATFAWLGCGSAREIEVDVMPDGTWNEVVHTTHPGDAMCGMCTFRIRAALTCPGHEMLDLPESVSRLSQRQIFRRLCDPSTKLASLPPLCAVCMKPADKQCNVRSESGVVCGLALCKLCSTALNLSAGSIERLINNRRQENDALRTMRADTFVFELVRKWHEQHD